MDIHIFFNC